MTYAIVPTVGRTIHWQGAGMSACIRLLVQAVDRGVDAHWFCYARMIDKDDEPLARFPIHADSEPRWHYPADCPSNSVALS